MAETEFIKLSSNPSRWTTYRRKWRALWRPNMFHGWGRKKGYFEGWYFKIVDKTENHVLAIIPGISLEEDGSSHCFIQILDGINRVSKYYEFDSNLFRPSEHGFELWVDRNYFSSEYISLNLPDLQGKIHFKNTVEWPKMLKAPGIMGWYSFVPFMECYHGIVSMHHSLTGHLNIKGRDVDFSNGIGYNEKDWGVSFPECWIWIHCNHFEENQNISLFASVAKIPWLKSHFIGFIAGFYINGQLYRFATYTGAKMKSKIIGDQVEVHYKDKNKYLKIIATKAAGADLKSPISGKMTGKVNESIQATVVVELIVKGEVRYSGNGRNTGLELAGNIDQLLSESWF